MENNQTETVELPTPEFNFNHTQSPGVGKIALAMSKAQGQMEGAKKDSKNPFFKSNYADLASVWIAIRKALSENEIAVFQPTRMEGDKVCIITKLIHSSGEWIEGEIALKPVKPDPQGQGSAITYMRRYALAAMCGVAQEDDDGNSASGKNETKKAPQKPTKPKPKKDPKARCMDGMEKLGFTKHEKELTVSTYSDDFEALLPVLLNIRDGKQDKDDFIENLELASGAA